MIIEKIKEASIEARKSNNKLAKGLLVTLFSEALMIGKNKRNDLPTDEECFQIIKKFKDNAQENLNLVGADNGSHYIKELEILGQFLPKQLDENEIKHILNGLILSEGLTAQDIGKAMNYMKNNYNGQYNGSLVSKIYKGLF